MRRMILVGWWWRMSNFCFNCRQSCWRGGRGVLISGRAFGLFEMTFVNEECFVRCLIQLRILLDLLVFTAHELEDV